MYLFFKKKKTTKYEYKPPEKPLPHKDPLKTARIGKHKIGDEDERPVSAPAAVKASSTIAAPATVTTAPSVAVTNNNVAANNEVKKAADESSKPKTIDFPSSFAPSLAPATTATTTTTVKTTTAKSDGPVRTLTNDERKLIKSKQSEAIEYLKQQAGFRLEALEKASTNTTTNKKELKAREKQAEKVKKKQQQQLQEQNFLF